MSNNNQYLGLICTHFLGGFYILKGLQQNAVKPHSVTVPFYVYVFIHNRNQLIDHLGPG